MTHVILVSIHLTPFFLGGGVTYFELGVYLDRGLDFGLTTSFNLHFIVKTKHVFKNFKSLLIDKFE